MSFAALQFLFWRVFMRITYTCPPHLSFQLHTGQWSQIIGWSREAIEWLSHNDGALDTLFIYSYTATSCALVQYHAWARRRDPSAIDTLRLVKDVASRWETAVQPDQMSIRRKTCETMTLLYEAALKTNPEGTEERMERPLAINPTAGVQPRENIGRAIFVKYPSRPDGIWVVNSEADREASGLMPEECILVNDLPMQLDKIENVDAPVQIPQPLPLPLPVPFQDIQSATNVNPLMNNGDLPDQQWSATSYLPNVSGITTDRGHVDG